MLIGFLLCAVGFLTIGATSANNDNGRFQAFGNNFNESCIIETHPGELFQSEWKSKGRSYWNQLIKPNTFKFNFVDK